MFIWTWALWAVRELDGAKATMQTCKMLKLLNKWHLSRSFIRCNGSPIQSVIDYLAPLELTAMRATTRKRNIIVGGCWLFWYVCKLIPRYKFTLSDRHSRRQHPIRDFREQRDGRNRLHWWWHRHTLQIRRGIRNKWKRTKLVDVDFVFVPRKP